MKIGSYNRFTVLFLAITGCIVFGERLGHFDILAQPKRFPLAMEMAIAQAAGNLVRRLWSINQIAHWLDAQREVHRGRDAFGADSHSFGVGGEDGARTPASGSAGWDWIYGNRRGVRGRLCGATGVPGGTEGTVLLVLQVISWVGVGLISVRRLAKSRKQHGAS